MNLSLVIYLDRLQSARNSSQKWKGRGGEEKTFFALKSLCVLSVLADFFLVRLITLEIISHEIMPNEKTSLVWSYHWPFKHSGLIQYGEPTVSNRVLLLGIFAANPKSPTTASNWPFVPFRMSTFWKLKINLDLIKFIGKKRAVEGDFKIQSFSIDCIR